MASMGSMTTTRRTAPDMLIPLGTLGADGPSPQSSARGRCAQRISPLEKTVNQATVVSPALARNVDLIPWLAGPGYVKKPQDSSTYARSLTSFKVSSMESMITNGKPKLAGLKVLVIDDSKTIRRTAETLLTKEGCEVFTAVDGFDA